ncbi:hypothetical protein BRAS3843_660031 [Bradyrhizobium sp. STM 3843]|nr:hypothetical protein BRAS3843_660031 [Bradyrhizobium sp. STM 3843]
MEGAYHARTRITTCINMHGSLASGPTPPLPIEASPSLAVDPLRGRKWAAADTSFGPDISNQR